MGDLTLAAVLTIAGAVASAALITGFIALLKNVRGFGRILDRENEPTAAFVLSALLVAWAYLTYGVQTPEGLFAAFLAFYAIAKLAMAIHDDVVRLGQGAAA